MADPLAVEWNHPGAYQVPSDTEQTSLGSGWFQHVKDLHVQVENYMKALPVNEESIKKAVDTIVQVDCPLPAKFSKISITDLLKKNKNIRGDKSLSTLVSALGLLEKYGRNLLKPERPPLWKCIYFANSVFRTRVDIIKGARDVLKLMGYSEVVEDGLSFPSDLASPNLDLVAIVTADLAISRRELELYHQGEHPHSYRVKDCLEGTMAMIQVPGDSPTGRPQNIFLRRQAHGTRTIYENVVPPPEGDILEQFCQLLDLEGKESGSPASELPPGSDAQHDPRPASAEAPTKPKPVTSANPASQVEGIVHRIGDTVPRSMPTKGETGLGYFTKTPKNVTQPQTTASNTEQQSTPVLSQAISQNTVIGTDKSSDCVMCGKTTAKFQCSTCSGLRCESCDKQWHIHPTRRTHQRKVIEPTPLIDATTSKSPVPILLCHVCGIQQSSVFCTDCSSSTCSGKYCSDCDRVYHGHPQRQNHSRQPLKAKSSEPVDKPPPENIVLSPVNVTSSQDSPQSTEASPAAAKKRPVPAPRRSVKKESTAKEPSVSQIPEGKATSSDDVFTLDKANEIQSDVKHPPQETIVRSQSDSAFVDASCVPVSPKAYHSLPSSKRDLTSEIEALVRKDIEILQQIQVQRNVMITCDPNSPVYETLAARMSSLVSGHERILKQQKDLELLAKVQSTSAEIAVSKLQGENVEVRYPPSESYKDLPSQQSSTTPATQIKYPPTDVTTTNNTTRLHHQGTSGVEPLKQVNQSTGSQPVSVGIPLTFMQEEPTSKPSIPAKPPVVVPMTQSSQSRSVTTSGPTPSVRNHLAVSPTRPLVVGNGTPTAQPGKVQQMMNRISAATTVTGAPDGSQVPLNGSQSAAGAWVCLQCGNHNTASAAAVCMTCRAPMPTGATQKLSVAALGQQLGPVLSMVAMPRPLQQPSYQASVRPARTEPPAPADIPAVTLPTLPPTQPETISVFTYLQMEEEAMLKEKQKAKEEYESRMAAEIEEKAKMPSPPPRIKKELKQAPADAPVSPRMKQAPSQGDALLKPHPQEVSTPVRSTSPRSPHIMWVEEKRRLDEQRSQSLEFIQMLREAEDEGFLPEEVSAASQQMQGNGGQTGDELLWLQGNWDDYISTVTTMATNHLKKEVGKSVGMVRRQEAKQALQMHLGSVKKAVEECVTSLQSRVLSLVDLGFPHKRVCELLCSRDGGEDGVLIQLQKERAQDFVDRIWTPEKVEYQEKLIVDLGVDRHPDTVERRLRILLAEFELPSWGRAITATKLIDMAKYNTGDAIIAAKECGDFERAKQFLEKECQVCFAQFPMNKLSTLINCQCMICLECLHGHFHFVITTRNIVNAKCPVCDQPDLRGDDQNATASYFAFLDLLLKGILEAEAYQLFQTKMRDWNLMKEDNFRWCAHCGNGFINEAPGRRKMRCNECGKVTCFQCKKPWMDQHENTSCADFQAWKEANDPNRQAEGLAIHLRENGIDCPHCKMRYELAKGGCMHFKCGQCTHEFCCGCSSPYKRGNECGRFASCRDKGIHAHHPRDCLFYLRDQDIKSLQKLLQKHNVEYKRDNPAAQQTVCSVMEQRETPDGLQDVQCGRDVVNAALCQLHYKEYLVSLINQNHIDPVEEYKCDDLSLILKRHEFAVPARVNRENEEAYRTRLLQEVKEKLPLEKKNPRDRTQSL
ncbi:E3 ubiquitin-protein ligase RNF31-like isoform X2 [Acanthaster planci]|uniref:E3 ubiquitin-protein ligase RNF31-like isoform X2 n=1 Tax=Acanthaster planci TaxID=133434 RepID=A0A8B7XT24_ACAPL|nr:E3 ubiquitin-protein ligase RNF31-like isoform X2 [Acanthaster planci]